jgi:hypothetical protein
MRTIMVKDRGSTRQRDDGAPDAAARRRERLAAALRANLGRRKAQARARKDAAPSGNDDEKP